MNLHHSHLGLWVIAEQDLRIGIFLTFIRIIRATINLATILCTYSKMIRYLDTIILQFRIQVIIEKFKVDSLLQRFIRSRIQHIDNHLIEKSFLINISILDNLRKRLLSLIQCILITTQDHRLRSLRRFYGYSLQLK